MWNNVDKFNKYEYLWKATNLHDRADAPTSSCSRPTPGCIRQFSDVVTEADVQAFHRERVHHEAGHSNIAGVRISQRGVTHHVTQHLDGYVGAQNPL